MIERMNLWRLGIVWARRLVNMGGRRVDSELVGEGNLHYPFAKGYSTDKV
jgi:hypothetical protein